MNEIIEQLRYIKEHLKWIKTEYIPVDFDIEVLEGCISRLNDIDQLILPHTIGNITFYSKKELIDWIENRQAK